MTREELTAIVAGIIQGVAVQGALTRGGRTNLEALAVECVDQAEIVIEEARKTPEQRAEERTAREVARKMTERTEAELKAAEAEKWAEARALVSAQQASRLSNPVPLPSQPSPLAVDGNPFLRPKSMRDFFKS